MKTNTKKNATTNTNTNTNNSRNNGRKGDTMKKFDVYEMVAERIIEELEKGVIPWQKPWFGTREGAIKRNGEPYSFMNQMLLGDDGEYIGFKQIQKEGGKINKGAKSKQVVFWKLIEKEEVGEDGEKKKKTIPYLTYMNVFNIKDTNLKPRERNEKGDCKPNELAEKVIKGYIKSSGIKFKNDKPSNKAYYRPSTDTVVVPRLDQYKDVEEYYSTAFHELTHSTGHESRLNRINKLAGFGSEEYGKEELVAELGAASLVNICGLESEKSFKNSAAYIENWKNAIKEDKRMIVSAAGKADKAVEMIVGNTLEEVEAEEPKEEKPKAKAKTKKATPKAGTFTKASYYIMGRFPNGERFQKVDGYITKVGSIKVGITKKDDGHWYATETTTGLGLNGVGIKTRKDAVKWVEDNMDIIKECLKTDRIKEAKKALTEYKKSIA